MHREHLTPQEVRTARRRIALAAIFVCASPAAFGCSISADDSTENAESTGAALEAELTIFNASDVPQVAADSDTSAVELGLRFRADVAGTVNGIRFLKASANTGTHVGHLWTNSGTLLSTVTFTGETAAGWQTARFASPVAIQPNVTYVASYHTRVGRYAATNDAFANAGLDRGPLHALRDRQDGRNGVYRYGTTPGFPTSTYRASNYFVDVLFQRTSAPTDAGTPPPTDGGTPPPTDGGTPPPSGTCDRTATTSTLAAQFSAATAGQAICLAAGNYGTWRGGAKSGTVTLRPQAGATVTMTIDFNGANNIRLEGLTIPDARLVNTTKNITIAQSRFTGHTIIDGVANSNILFDGNQHVGIMTCPACDPAMIHLAYGGSTHSGVTITRSLFADGNSDGIQTGIGVNIIGNEFRNIRETGPDDTAHSDPIQLLGASGSVVRGNWIHHSADGIVAYDGIDHATIEDNVVDLVNGRWGIELYSDNGSIIRHNTLRYATTCEYAACGQIILDHKSADPAGRGTIIVDNIATSISLNSGSTAARIEGNMLRQGPGAGNFLGTPVYVGGAAPTNIPGFKLAAGSPGKARATDGLDVGIR
jgi:hypothetical protein